MIQGGGGGGGWSSTAVSGMEEGDHSVCERECERCERERERERLCWHLRDVDVEDRGAFISLG